MTIAAVSRIHKAEREETPAPRALFVENWSQFPPHMVGLLKFQQLLDRGDLDIADVDAFVRRQAFYMHGTGDALLPELSSNTWARFYRFDVRFNRGTDGTRLGLLVAHKIHPRASAAHCSLFMSSTGIIIEQRALMKFLHDLVRIGA